MITLLNLKYSNQLKNKICFIKIILKKETLELQSILTQFFKIITKGGNEYKITKRNCELVYTSRFP